MSEEIANFFNELERVHQSKLPYVAFRKPDEDLVSAFVQRTHELHDLKSYKEAGFVFAPFNAAEKKIFFPFFICWLYITFASSLVQLHPIIKITL